ncbi:hypothetical protein Btru_060385 [Bulinus truncatus]|nr:hypothetical protein Btru_060385 [Bulinus truncatus]
MPTELDGILFYASDYVGSKACIIPNEFKNHILTALKVEKKYPSTYVHPNSLCSRNCTECLLLCAITASNAVFNYNFNEVNEKRNSEELNSTSSSTQYTKCIDDWYKETADLLLANNVANLLIRHLSCSCIFVSYQAKKALLSLMKRKFISVPQTLMIINEECRSNCITGYLDLLRDLLSSRLFSETVNTKTLNHVLSSDFICSFLSSKFDATQNTFSSIKEIFEYLLLLSKVIKQGLKTSESFMNYSGCLCYLLQTSVLPYTNAFFSLPLKLKGNLICSKYLKLVSDLLGSIFLQGESLVPQCVIDLSNTFFPQLLNNFQNASSSGLLSKNSFVSTDTPITEFSPQLTISVMSKLILEVSLKSCAISLTEKDRQPFAVADTLHSIWLEMQHLISKEVGLLPSVFGDQDDKWIISLLCLLKIWTQLNKWVHSYCQDSSMPFTVIRLLLGICPHKLFNQFVHFVSYDHLILADFLTSPETEFLNYFTLYLHAVIDNWDYFYSSHNAHLDRFITVDHGCRAGNSEFHVFCSREDMKIKLPHNFHETMQTFESITDNNSASHFNENNSERNEKVQKTYCKNLLVSYSDSESDESNEDSEVCPVELSVVEKNLKPQCAGQGIALFNREVLVERNNFSVPNPPSQEIVKVLEMFIRLRLYIERMQDKNLFPYNAKPLLRLLEKIENMYDNVCTRLA